MVHIVSEISNVKTVPEADFLPVFVSLRLFITKLWDIFLKKKISVTTYENTHGKIVISVFL